MTGVINLFIVGSDATTLDLIRSSLDDSRIQYKLTFFQEVSEIKLFSEGEAEAVFLYSNRPEDKTFQEIRKLNQLLPNSAVILLSTKAQLRLIIGAFRAGLFDFLALPLDKAEMRTVIYRLKLHGIIRHKHLSPERAILQFFSRPENFSSVDDVNNSLKGYLETFFRKEREAKFFVSEKLITSFTKKLKLSKNQINRLENFLNDRAGIIFGLKVTKNYFYFLFKTGPEQISFVVAKNVSKYSVKEVLNDYLATFLRTSLVILDENSEREQFKLLTMIDDVTGLYNQRKLSDDLENLILNFKNESNMFTLLFIDIDHFKNVNDRFGHIIGSKLLVDLATVLKKQLRASDIVYRYGGDEFIIILPNTDTEIAKKIALRMSSAVKAEEFEVENFVKYRLSLSIGIASYPQDAPDAKSIIRFADQMMYLSKRSGRGKVFHINEVIGK